MHDPTDFVTLVIQHEVKPASRAAYEAWLKKIAQACQRFRGHLGVNIIRPHGTTHAYVIVLRFDSHDHLMGWIESDARKELLARADPLFLSAEELEIQSGLEYWFTPPSGKPVHAKPFKQFLITLSAIFPLTVIVPWALAPIVRWLPPLGWPVLSNFIVASIVVALMVYVVMPRYTRLMARWLFR
ncbi:antibiotic biosynthesis monooxygenase [Variovorax sp. WS11]|uniref:antibiotic biosynthesis monooxygenase n=1 Tax=Variovorax sp. WS11 TaxID=1105204 RepID=UPI000D0D8351|nr:antibiotic biosynthesis monooxygenase [Variovorax sp. WS11]NDZ17527.1 antibiotic biosynthesis monooxygenase [Variovorax sp. WS11]PSL85948.1 antibiotic biosynthesis monooxygenase [Variovorax sp. WS11]